MEKIFTVLLGDKSKLWNNRECDPIWFFLKECKDQPILYVYLWEYMCIHLEKWPQVYKQSYVPSQHEAVLGGRRQKVTIVFHLDLCVVLILYNEKMSVQYVYTNSGKHPNKITADNTLPEVTTEVPPRTESIEYFGKILIPGRAVGAFLKAGRYSGITLSKEDLTFEAWIIRNLLSGHEQGMLHYIQVENKCIFRLWRLHEVSRMKNEHFMLSLLLHLILYIPVLNCEQYMINNEFSSTTMYPPRVKTQLPFSMCGAS